MARDQCCIFVSDKKVRGAEHYMWYVDFHYDQFVPLKTLVMAYEQMPKSRLEDGPFEVEYAKKMMRPIMIKHCQYSVPELADETLVDDLMDRFVKEAILLMLTFKKEVGNDYSFELMKKFVEDTVEEPVINIDFIDLGGE